MTFRTPKIVLALAAVPLLIAAIGPAQDTQTVDAGGLKFEAPKGWTPTPTKASMRRAQLAVKKVEGDKDDGELVVFAFPGGVGSIDDNVKRWEGQFKNETGSSPKASRDAVKGKNATVTRVEITGSYTDTLNNKGPFPDYQLLGAIVDQGTTTFVLKFVGPKKTITASKESFDALLKTIEVVK